MLNSAYRYFNDLMIFLFIFSMYNDKFIVDVFGESSLKIILISIILMNFLKIIEHLKIMTQMQEKLLLMFLFLEMMLLMSQIVAGYDVTFEKGGFALIGIFVVALLFIHYPIKRLIYMIWITIMASVVMSYYNPPLSEWSFRKSGGTDDPNEFATQLLVFLSAAFYLYTQNKSKLFLITSIAFFTYGILHAGSKSSFLMLGVLALLSVIRLLIIKPRIFFGYKALLGFLLLLGVITQINFTQYKAVSNVLDRAKGNATAEQRIHSWIAGKHMVENNPFFGVGVNEFTAHEPTYEEGHMVRSAPAPHNVYVKLIAESGIPIFILFILFISYIIIRNFNILFYTNEWWVLMMLLAVLLMGLTLGMAYDRYFWLPIVLLMNINHQLNKKGIIA